MRGSESGSQPLFQRRCGEWRPSADRSSIIKGSARDEVVTTSTAAVWGRNVFSKISMSSFEFTMIRNCENRPRCRLLGQNSPCCCGPRCCGTRAFGAHLARRSGDQRPNVAGVVHDVVLIDVGLLFSISMPATLKATSFAARCSQIGPRRCRRRRRQWQWNPRSGRRPLHGIEATVVRTLRAAGHSVWTPAP